MKASSLPAVLALTLLAVPACGTRRAASDDTVPTIQAVPAADASSDEDTKTAARPAPEPLNRPAAARPGSGAYGTTSSGTVLASAEGVDVARVARVRREVRKREEPDPRARAEADRANAALEGSVTASELAALRALEEAVVAELNRLRGDPAAYAGDLAGFGKFYRGDTVTVPGYMGVRTREGTAAVDDAIAVVTSVEPMPPLSRSEGLTRAARAYAYRLGKGGVLFHGNATSPHDRMALYGRVSGMFAENVGAVYREARLMILEQFVDDGVETRVHRYNMIGPMFRVVGVGCSPHPKYDVVCVMDFVEQYHEADD